MSPGKTIIVPVKYLLGDFFGGGRFRTGTPAVINTLYVMFTSTVGRQCHPPSAGWGHPVRHNAHNKRYKTKITFSCFMNLSRTVPIGLFYASPEHAGRLMMMMMMMESHGRELISRPPAIFDCSITTRWLLATAVHLVQRPFTLHCKLRLFFS